MDYNHLLQAYEKLLTENSRLKKENNELKHRLGLNVTEQPKPKSYIDMTANINQASSAVDKIQLFMSLFRGREDVFARRWYSQTLKRGGYQPVCQNEWKPALCDKKKHKCKDCPNRVLLPISTKDIEKHLTGNDQLGRDVVGIYPMLPNETCYFLAVDFDDGDYKDDVSAFRIACKENNVPVALRLLLGKA